MTTLQTLHDLRQLRKAQEFALEQIQPWYTLDHTTTGLDCADTMILIPSHSAVQVVVAPVDPLRDERSQIAQHARALASLRADSTASGLITVQAEVHFNLLRPAAVRWRFPDEFD